jgi:diguanylate cyclase (GGDEF)-like protein
MKKAIFALVFLFGWVLSSWAGAPETLTTLHAVRSLSNAEANKRLPVAFEATVTYYRGYENTLFVQDGGDAIFVSAPKDAGFVPGDRVLVRGKTMGSFNPIILSESVVLLRHGGLPQPEKASFDALIRGDLDCKFVIVRGIVRAADVVGSTYSPVRSIRLQMIVEGGDLNVNLDSSDPSLVDTLLDAEAEVTGVAAEEFDSKMQQTGILLHTQQVSAVQVQKKAKVDPWSLPPTPMDRILSVYHTNDLTPRIRVHGTITYYEPGAAVVLQDGEKSTWIATQTRNPLRIGDGADAIGFPDTHDGFLNLDHAEIRDNLVYAPATPLPSTWKSLTPDGYNALGHHFDLVSIEGRLVNEFSEAYQDQYVLEAGGRQFTVVYRHHDGPPAIIKRFPLGANVHIVGICVLANSNPFDPEVPFQILMRSYDDMTIIARPSPLNVRNLVILVVLLLVLIAIAGTRGWILERKVRQKTAALALVKESEATQERRSASLEHIRSGILEDINGARPQGEILDKVAEMLSTSLDGAPCWCEVGEGFRQGYRPPEPHGLRIVSAAIEGRSGESLGRVFAGLDPTTPASDREMADLGNAARLATLAIETRRLYNDLRRRTEFDLLTDIHNRFSLHKRLDTLLEDARQNQRVFGLVYIDLDKFKPINDQYGHHAGDVFLQQVALRLKSRLRGNDILARLGGDEFAALISVKQGREEVESVVDRLERCFDEPFSVEGHTLDGAASFGIACYPEDGATKDELLSFADAAMYTNKKRKKAMEAGQG